VDACERYDWIGGDPMGGSLGWTPAPIGCERPVWHTPAILSPWHSGTWLRQSSRKPTAVRRGRRRSAEPPHELEGDDGAEAAHRDAVERHVAVVEYERVVPGAGDQADRTRDEVDRVVEVDPVLHQIRPRGPRSAHTGWFPHHLGHQRAEWRSRPRTSGCIRTRSPRRRPRSRRMSSTPWWLPLRRCSRHMWSYRYRHRGPRSSLQGRRHVSTSERPV